MGFFQHVVVFLGPWTWWVLGVGLATVEIFAPGTFFIWLAIAAILTGTAAMTVTIGWQSQLVVFVVLAIVSALVGRKVYGRSSHEGDGLANDRATRQFGRLAVLDTAIAQGTGHMRLDDTLWRVEGPDLPPGAKVRIVGYRDGRFVVESAD